MDKQFDELSKSLAQGVSRREALRKFGLGLAGVLLATVGLTGKASAHHCKQSGARCNKSSECCSGFCGYGYAYPHKASALSMIHAASFPVSSARQSWTAEMPAQDCPARIGADLPSAQRKDKPMD